LGKVCILKGYPWGVWGVSPTSLGCFPNFFGVFPQLFWGGYTWGVYLHFPNIVSSHWRAIDVSLAGMKR
jgi:hypothetical protein